MAAFNRLSSVGENVPINEPYMGQYDPLPITHLIMPHEELHKYLLKLSHLSRTTNYNEKYAFQAWIRFKSSVRMDRARHRDKPYLIELLKEIEDAGFQIIFGDAYLGKRQGYLGTQRRSIEVLGQRPDQRSRQRSWRPW